MSSAPAAGDEQALRPLLTVVVPVYNQAGTIVENVRTIRERIERNVDGQVEVIVVSDGSLDGSEERLLADESHRARVIHYDRNLGKGFAVKAGSLAAAGQYISYVDADLDLDPARVPGFLEIARAENLDFVIGSKRHPESLVEYPRARRISSWLYQQLVRTLFDLEVRDTQVGMKVFRREVAEEVMPLLLVKQYAFDLELLAVARALGFDRVREQPIALDYKFTGSGVRSIAVFYALVDTAAIFYRLRVLGYYQRRRDMLASTAPLQGGRRPRVTLIAPAGAETQTLAYPDLGVSVLSSETPAARRQAAERADGEILAFLGPGSTPSGNWLDSTVPFLGRADVAAVVVPTVTPVHGPARERAAGAIWESRLGGGRLRFRFTPGNLRFVDQYPTDTVVVRREDFLALNPHDVSEHRLAAALVERGKRVVYTPDTVVVRREPPLFAPHLERAAAFGAGRASDIRRDGPRAIRPLTLAPAALVAYAALGWPLARAGGAPRKAWLGGWALYGAAVAVGSVSAGLRHRSLAVGALTAAGSVATHVTYGAAFLRALVRR